ncbi:hypothetical protein ACXYRK_03835 [Mycoplasma sp. AC1221]
MKINFKSTTKQNGESKDIDFISVLDYEFDDGYHILTFSEPSQGIRNRIEISETNINIYAGATTVYLKYQKEFKFLLDLEGYNWRNQAIELVSNWFYKNFADDLFEFTYTLAKDGQLLGEYAINLTLIKD